MVVGLFWIKTTHKLCSFADFCIGPYNLTTLFAKGFGIICQECDLLTKITQNDKGKKKKVPQSLFPNLFPIELSVLFLLKYSCSIEAKLWHPYSCWVSWYAEGTLCEQERARFWHFCCCCALCLQDSHKLDFLIFLLFFFFSPRLEGLKLTSSVQTPNLLCLKRILKISPHVLR